MLAKMTKGNRIALPDSALKGLEGNEVFEVTRRGDAIVLTPVMASAADAARARLDALGITEKDVADAVDWARSRSDGAAG